METLWSILADPTALAAISALSALAAVPIAVVALLSSHRTARRMVEIEEARDLAAERESSRAMLATDWEISQHSTSHGTRWMLGGRLTVGNQGGGPARRVRVSIDGVDVTRKASSPLDADGRVTRLDPGAVFSIHFSSEDGNYGAFHRVRVEWEDGSGEPGLYESEL